jgi:hypothetical protein
MTIRNASTEENDMTRRRSTQLNATPYSDLMNDLGEMCEAGNRHAVRNIVVEMASRRGVTARQMSWAIRNGRAASITRQDFSE